MKHIKAGNAVSRLLVQWYSENKRDLPWRHTSDPYKIWISETILQQTRVAQGLEYYLRFIDRFPTVVALAQADEEEVLKYWQGLGYYSRARNLLVAAKTVVSAFNGIFPSDYKDILSLKGIGDYTAAAIVSFAWNKPYPVVDGNVFRVLSRLFAVDTPIDTSKGKKEFTLLANEILDETNALNHNQAIMDLGALVCTPQNPSCSLCPLWDKCAACSLGKVLDYPVKQHKTKSRDRFFHYFYIDDFNYTFLHRRTDKDIWEGLFEFPLIETSEPADFNKIKDLKNFKDMFGTDSPLDVTLVIDKKKHVLSHQVIYASFYRVRLSGDSYQFKDLVRVSREDLDNYAMPRLLHIYLEKQAENFAN